MKTTRFYKWLIGILLIMNGTTLYLLWNSGRITEERHPPRKSLVDVLELKGKAGSEVQRMEKEHFHMKDSLIARSRSLHEELFRSFSNPEKDSTDITGLIDRIVENQRITEQMTFDYFRQVSKWCTPKQRIRLQKAIHHAITRMGVPPRRR